MIKKRTWLKVVLTTAFFVSTYVVVAQNPDPFDGPPDDLPSDGDNPDEFNGEPPDFVPIDTNMLFLLCAGVSYAGYFLIRKPEKKGGVLK